jgi:uncharacterized repeat protein (TIGR01451 family)
MLMAGSFVAAEKAEAQSFGISITNSASSLLVSNSLTYTIDVTNLIPGLLPIVVVSNVLPASVQFVSASSTQGSFTNYGNINVFYLGLFQLPTAEMILTVQPTAVGSITNMVTIATTNLITITPVSTNIVTTVTNTVPPEADLGVTMTGSAQPTNIVNDPITYGITATNLGPDDASNVQLTNSLPAGVIFEGVSPANQPYSLSGSNLIFSLSTLAAGAGTNLQITVQATNAGVFNISASLGTADVTDTNTANNSASTNLTVINYLSTNLTVSLVTSQKYNPQNGLVEQTIEVSNIGTNAVPAARVLVSGLTNVLFNASGTNSGNPFVVYVTTLDTNQSMNLLLQFYAPNYFPFLASQCQAFGVPVPNLTPPAVSSASTSLNISRILRLANGNMLIEFPTTVGRSYSVVYSSNGSLPGTIAPPSIVAVGNRMQWIDYGPPTTISAPTNAAARLYRVIQNP